tara:strand:+ start:1205 stop:1513 length:309 start_codon:yes stop_codon:yes gene_type:complete
MLSTKYRLKLQFICKKIVLGEEVQLEDMIWAEKLAKANSTAATWLRQARRKAENPDMVDGGIDDFMNMLDLGNRGGRGPFEGADDILDFFRQEKPDDWRQRD